MPKAWITAYDVFSARIAEAALVDAILVGDSLAMTVYGHENTTSMTKEIMRWHFEAVKKTAKQMRIILDIPFGADEHIVSFIETLEFFAEKGATEYKMELHEDNFACLLEARSRGYDIVAHLGHLPQSQKKVHITKPHTKEAEKLISLAKRANALGVSALLLECVSEELAKSIKNTVSCEVIGIGAGRFVDGQVLVFDDVIGKTSQSFSPKFLRRFGNIADSALASVKDYVLAVQTHQFPSSSEIYE